MDKCIDELSEKKYRDGVHKDNSIAIKNISNIPILRDIVIGFHNREFYRICQKYLKKDYRSIFEIGCAPGNYLVQFYKKFGLTPYGIEYSKNGINILENNFIKNKIPSNIIYGDFFDNDFLQANHEKYNIVFSGGFIEHFSDPAIAIENHFKLTKKGGIVVIVIPNLYYLNKYFTSNEVLKIHNLKIMQLQELKQYVGRHEILCLQYFGGLFNIGAFSYKTLIFEKLRFLFFLLQRLLIDPIFMIFRKIGVNLSNKYTSPSIIMICKKN